jgi:endonuclease/exonuclease/phosphatase family metal-dependent hydrolase
MSVKKNKIIIGLVVVGSISVLVVIWVLSASRIGPVETCLTACTRYHTEESNQFVVLNLNILHGYPEFDHLSERLDLIANQILLLEPDFVTLQEVPWTWNTRSAAKYLSEKSGMNYVYLPANGNRCAILFSEGEAILSKYPLKDVEYRELKPRAGFFEHRVALKVTAIVPGGEIHLISTHLTNSEPKINQKQTQNLYQMVSSLSGRPVIVAGDFNAREDSIQIKYLSDNWIDTFRQSNPHDPGPTCCVDVLTGPNIDTELEKRIDFIFLVPEAKPTTRVLESKRVFTLPYSVEKSQLWASDHIGIISSFETTPGN